METCVGLDEREMSERPQLTSESLYALRMNHYADELEAERDDLRARKDGAYEERNRLVAAIAKMFPASLERHPDADSDWEDDWRWVVYIDLPTGQASWHIHDSHLPLFDGLPRLQGRKWDGHSTLEKYARLAALPR